MVHKNTSIPLIKNTCDLYKKFYDYWALFPKKDRHALGAKCEQYISTILELLLAASYARRDDKLGLLKRASTKLDTLKLFLRLLKELSVIDAKKYLALQGQIQEIGRMLGGWQKSL